MTNKKRFLMALTVVSFLTVTGLVIGCDSDDGPKVTPPSGGGGATATRNTTAETQGREGLEATDNGTMIRNTGEVALNVRFAYDTPRHYRLNVNTAMPSDPASAGSAPARVACGVPATGRANGQCFNNDRSEIQSAPTPYSSGNGDNGNGDNGNGDNGNGDNGNGDNGNGDNGAGGGGGSNSRWDSSLAAVNCTEYYTQGRSETFRHRVRNTCGREISARVSCSVDSLRPSYVFFGRQTYNSPSDMALGTGGSRTFSGDMAPGEDVVIIGASDCFSRGGNLVWAACYGNALTVTPYFLSSDSTSYNCLKD